MTEVLEGQLRVTTARPSVVRSDPVASVWIRGAFAALWAAALGLASLVVIALVVWAADSRSNASAGASMRFSAQLWLLAHRTPLRVPGGALTLPPLGLTLVLGMLVARATSIVARGSRCADARDFAVIVASVAVPYATIATVLAITTASTSIRPSGGAAFVCATLVAGLFASIGAARGAGVNRAMWRALPLELRASLRAAGGSALVLTGAAAVLTLGALVAHLHRFDAIVDGYQGAPGIFTMLLLSLLLVPNALVFSFGYLVGPGFALGAGTSVTFGGAHVGAMPALPLLAAVPAGRAPLPVLIGCVVAVAAAGAVGGWRVTRWSISDLRGQVNMALIAAAVLGLGAAVLVAFAGGPSGPGRLSAVGSSPWQVGLAVAAEMAVTSTLVVVLCWWARRRRRLSSATAG